MNAMTKWTSYNNEQRENLIPNCPNCNVTVAVQLIDVALDRSNTEAKTIPVWHCSNCNRGFAARTHLAGNMVSAGSYDSKFTNENTNYDPDEVNAKKMIPRGSNLHYDVKMIVDEQVATLKKEVEDLKNWYKDPVNSLRKSVGKFELK